jgi:hypothetical protein
MEKLISPAAYARRIGVNRSTISRQIARGKIPTIDGLIDPGAADKARDRNLDQVRRQTFAQRRITAQHAKRPVLVEALNLLAAPAEVLAFARVALRIGCTAQQAFVLGTWYSCQPALALPVEPVDLDGFEEVTPLQWRKLLGADFDVAAAQEAYEIATFEELKPRDVEG